VAVADFNKDGKDDLVVSQTRTDQVSIQLNNTPQPGDGVIVTRDVPYVSDQANAVAERHTLDVYLPAGKKDFPVVFFIFNDRSWTISSASGNGYLAQTFAREGIGAVVANHRSADDTNGNGIPDDDPEPYMEAMMTDVAHAFAWTHENIGRYGGDADNVYVLSHGSGAQLIALLATDESWLNAQGLNLSAIRGAIGVSGLYDFKTRNPPTLSKYSPVDYVSADDPPFLLLHGTNASTEHSLLPQTYEFYAAIKAARGQADIVPVQDRDHFEMIGRLAEPGDPGRQAILTFIAENEVLADLQVTRIVASNNRGNTITLTATVANPTENNAPASQTEFRLDDGTVLGLVATPAIAKGGTATVTLDWKPKGVKGEHVMTVTADMNGAVRESDETNNAATLTVSIKGNKVTNGSFDQANADGTGPDGWASSSTPAGTTSWNAEAGSVSFTGTGGSALLSGSPTWTSDPIAVTAGESLNLTASVSSVGASSGATVSLAYFDAAGHLLSTAPVLSVSLTTGGFVTLRQQVMAPLGAASVRVVLTGFAASDPATAGTVTFDGVGLYDLNLLSAGFYLFLDDDLPLI
jgi:acetyl esterase/lipase